MNTDYKLTVLALIILFCLGAAGISFAADNTATDGGGGFSLVDSGTVIINPLAQPTLMKAVFDGSGNCVSSSDDPNPLCNNTDTASAPSGSTLTFVIYVANPSTSSVDLSDIRINDGLIGFNFVPGSLSYGTRAADGADWNNIYAAAVPGTSGSDGANPGDPVSYDALAVPDPLVSAGGPGGAGNNDIVTVIPNQVFAIAFDVVLP
jgi:hypothetical protein